MTKTKKLALGVVTVFFLFCSGVYAEATSQENIAYDLWVGGVQITSENLVIDSSDDAGIKNGTAIFTPETSTLTLDNFVYEGNGYLYDHYEDDEYVDYYYASIYCHLDELNIILSGSSSLTSTDDDVSDGVSNKYTTCEKNGISCGEASVTISGDSLDLFVAGDWGCGIDTNTLIIDGADISVEAKTTGGGILVQDLLAIDNGSNIKVDIRGTNEWGVSGLSSNGTLTVNNSSLDIDLSATNSENGCKGIFADDFTATNSNVDISANFVTSDSPHGIYCNDSIIIDGGNVNITVSGDNIIGLESHNKEVVIHSGTVNVDVGGKNSKGLYSGKGTTMWGGTINAMVTGENGICISNDVILNGGSVISYGEAGAFSKALVVADIMSCAKLWYGEDEATAVSAGEKPMSELAENYSQKYVRLVPVTNIILTDNNISAYLKEESGATLVAASYIGEKMHDVKLIPIPSGAYKDSIENIGLDTSGADTVKAFLWSDMTNLKPLCEADEITLEK